MQLYHNRFHFKSSEDIVSVVKIIRSDKYLITLFLLWAGSFVIMLIVVLVNYSSLPSQIPLFYSRLWGEGQLANKEFITLPLGGVLLLGIFNIAIGVGFYQRDRIMTYLLSGAAALASLLAAITIVNVIRLLL